jgi:hypothetical protein
MSIQQNNEEVDSIVGFFKGEEIKVVVNVMVGVKNKYEEN